MNSPSENSQVRERPDEPEPLPPEDAAETIRDKYRGFRLTVRKGQQTASWPPDWKQKAVEATGGGDADSVQISDKLFAASIPSVKAVNAILSEIEQLRHDRFCTLPYPLPGVSLVRASVNGRNFLETLNTRMHELRRALRLALEDMQADMPNIREIMKGKLKDRYRDEFYEIDVREQFDVSWAFPELDVPGYLAECPELYQQELGRVRGVMESVVARVEEQEAKKLQEVISYITDRLKARQLVDGEHTAKAIETVKGQYHVTYRDPEKEADVTVVMEPEEYRLRVSYDERPRVFRDATVNVLFEEIDFIKHQLQENGVGRGNLEIALDRLQSMVHGYTPESLPTQLRANKDFREQTRERLSELSDILTDAMVPAQSRKRDVVRKRKPKEQSTSSPDVEGKRPGGS